MFFIKAYFIGMIIALTIGPISLLIFQRGISKGVRSGVATAFGVALADCTFALAACFIGVSLLVFIEQYERYVYLFSGVVLLGLGLHVLQSARTAYRQKTPRRAVVATGSDCLSAYVLTIHNPMTILVFLGFLSYMTGIRSLGGIFLFALFLFLGSLTVQLSIAIIGSSLRRFFQNSKSILFLNMLSALGIIAFAVMSFWKVL